VSRSVKPFDDLSTCPLSRASPTSSPQGGESRQTKKKMQPSVDSDPQWTEKHHPPQGLTRQQTPGSDSTNTTVGQRCTWAGRVPVTHVAHRQHHSMPPGSPTTVRRGILHPTLCLPLHNCSPVGRSSSARVSRAALDWSTRTLCGRVNHEQPVAGVVQACVTDASLTRTRVHLEPTAAGAAVPRTPRSAHHAPHTTLRTPRKTHRTCGRRRGFARPRGTRRRAGHYADHQADCMSCRYFTSDCEEPRRKSCASSQMNTRGA